MIRKVNKTVKKTRIIKGHRIKEYVDVDEKSLDGVASSKLGDDDTFCFSEKRETQKRIGKHVCFAFYVVKNGPKLF